MVFSLDINRPQVSIGNTLPVADTPSQQFSQYMYGLGAGASGLQALSNSMKTLRGLSNLRAESEQEAAGLGVSTPTTIGGKVKNFLGNAFGRVGSSGVDEDLTQQPPVINQPSVQPQQPLNTGLNYTPQQTVEFPYTGTNQTSSVGYSVNPMAQTQQSPQPQPSVQAPGFLSGLSEADRNALTFAGGAASLMLPYGSLIKGGAGILGGALSGGLKFAGSPLGKGLIGGGGALGLNKIYERLSQAPQQVTQQPTETVQQPTVEDQRVTPPVEEAVQPTRPASGDFSSLVPAEIRNRQERYESIKSKPKENLTRSDLKYLQAYRELGRGKEYTEAVKQAISIKKDLKGLEGTTDSNKILDAMKKAEERLQSNADFKFLFTGNRRDLPSGSKEQIINMYIAELKGDLPSGQTASTLRSYVETLKKEKEKKKKQQGFFNRFSGGQ